MFAFFCWSLIGGHLKKKLAGRDLSPHIYSLHIRWSDYSHKESLFISTEFFFCGLSLGEECLKAIAAAKQ